MTDQTTQETTQETTQDQGAADELPPLRLDFLKPGPQSPALYPSDVPGMPAGAKAPMAAVLAAYMQAEIPEQPVVPPYYEAQVEGVGSVERTRVRGQGLVAMMQATADAMAWAASGRYPTLVVGDQARIAEMFRASLSREQEPIPVSEMYSPEEQERSERAGREAAEHIRSLARGLSLEGFIAAHLVAEQFWQAARMILQALAVRAVEGTTIEQRYLFTAGDQPMSGTSELIEGAKEGWQYRIAMSVMESGEGLATLLANGFGAQPGQPGLGKMDPFAPPAGSDGQLH